MDIAMIIAIPMTAVSLLHDEAGPMAQRDLAERETAHRHREGLHAAVAGLAGDDREQDGEGRVLRDGVLEEAHDERREEGRREVDLEPGQAAAHGEGDGRERALVATGTHHGLKAGRRGRLARRHECGVTDDADEPAGAVNDRKGRDALPGDRCRDLLAGGLGDDRDARARRDGLQALSGLGGDDLRERDGSAEAPFRVGEEHGVELLLLEGAQPCQGVFHGHVGAEGRDARVHERPGGVGREGEELEDVRPQAPRQGVQDALAGVGLDRGQDVGGAVVRQGSEDRADGPLREGGEKCRGLADTETVQLGRGLGRRHRREGYPGGGRLRRHEARASWRVGAL
ncbi:MAG: hypothetical protein HYX56_04550 [Chloroflexi bacterium]|nr:hypothetical protein [Chloroflexota bacterium]